MFEAILILFLLGLSLGSFINVCIYRVPRGISIVTIPSFCPSCHRTLLWYELLPIASFILSKGRCRTCTSTIPVRYPFVEAAIGMFFVFLFVLYGITAQFLFFGPFFVLMFLIAIVDWQHFIVPNQFILAGFVLSGIWQITFHASGIMQSIIFSLLTSTTTLLVLYIGNYFIKKETMGLGDVKLAGLIGLYMGFQHFLIAFWFAAILGSLYGIFKTFLRLHRDTTDNPSSVHETSSGSSSELRIPFGAFLAFTSSCVLLLEDQINTLINKWWILIQ